jgi:hypothetical protein
LGSSLSLSNAVAGSSPYKIGLPQTTRHHSASDFGEKVGGEKEEGKKRERGERRGENEYRTLYNSMM